MNVVLFLFVLGSGLIQVAQAQDWPHDGIDSEAFRAARAAYEAHGNAITNIDVMTIVDYSLPSKMPRLFVLDRAAGTVTTYLVAHGRGSDTDFDGQADHFSNEPNSKASALGAYRTGKSYIGQHGLSLKLEGLDATNNNAAARAIVLHGASYVSPSRRVLGRSWGCPAVEERFVQPIVERIRAGSLLFIYAATEL